jgi:hypothetical protein
MMTRTVNFNRSAGGEPEQWSYFRKRKTSARLQHEASVDKNKLKIRSIYGYNKKHKSNLFTRVSHAGKLV